MLARHAYISRLLASPFHNEELRQHDEEQRAYIERLEAEKNDFCARCAQQEAELQSWREVSKSVGVVDPPALARHLNAMSQKISNLEITLQGIAMGLHPHMMEPAQYYRAQAQAALAKAER